MDPETEKFPAETSEKDSAVEESIQIDNDHTTDDSSKPGDDKNNEESPEACTASLSDTGIDKDSESKSPSAEIPETLKIHEEHTYQKDTEESCPILDKVQPGTQDVAPEVADKNVVSEVADKDVAPEVADKDVAPEVMDTDIGSSSIVTENPEAPNETEPGNSPKVSEVSELQKASPEKTKEDETAEFSGTIDKSDVAITAEKDKSLEDIAEVSQSTTEPLQSQSISPEPEKLSETPDENFGKKPSEDPKPDSESMSLEVEAQRQRDIEKQIEEPENTEFVQITQDKNDDTQNEAQSMDAEDPFGAENLIPDIVESSEIDSPADDVNFRKLGDQADNLQDVVNAKDTNFKARVSSENKNQDKNKTVISTDSADSETNDKTSGDKSETEPMIVDSPNESNDEKKKKNEDNENDPMETEDSQSNVLPGQDDELCIIPDSMKEAADKPDEGRTESEKEKSVGNDPEKNSSPVNQDQVDIVAFGSSKITDDTSKEKDSGDKEKRKEPTKEVATPALYSDIIEIEEDTTKNVEIDKTPIDVCKQCNMRKTCAVNVKLGTENFMVCSQACKLAFTEANNRAMDIPSDGVNSKREKRCAGCLLIVEEDEERNLSWETMEFCNEECLGKFQTKYGSYCRNCNGSVQPMSLGKYCVRFGYDVRQFCCSTCLEEFKKGLKVCSYCQKDISTGTEGFLAPVGDKAQFRDFCTQYCMEKYSKMNSGEPPCVETKACGVCQEVRVCMLRKRGIFSLVKKFDYQPGE